MKHLISIVCFLINLNCAGQGVSSFLDSLNRIRGTQTKLYDRDSISNLYRENMEALFHRSCGNSAMNPKHVISSDSISSSQVKTLAYVLMNWTTHVETDSFHLYSWDQRLGGPFHLYSNYLILKSTNGGCCQVFYLDSVEAAGFYKVHSFDSFKIALGYGTYGGGKHHVQVLVFQVDGRGYFSIEDKLMIYCNRNQDPMVTFDESSGLLKFKEHLINYETEFYSNEYVWRELVLDQGSFKRLN